VVVDAAEHVGEPGFGVDVIELDRSFLLRADPATSTQEERWTIHFGG
jgi:hypothetical protein